MKTKFVAVLALLGAFVFTAAAADVTGKYAAEVPGRQGATQTTTFNLKAEGATLTGTVTNPRGDTKITDGKVDGDKVSFTTVQSFNGNDMKMTYTGKVTADGIEFSRMREGQDQAQTFTAKKQ